ncbi:Fibronectin type III domain protein [Fimbriiglobus ruber]|uniref:Fibronectin type III domain protein n=2 Tax=Fimbriiglobus ruber TaxID=1908690 RepID=A0A225DDH9_9BACT|nr:Fibronectin type III domain protein [Fimbriiglobus ruber]
MRLGLAQLEDRITPASFVVSNTNDTTAAGTLRTAINSVNASTDPTNTITFLPGLFGTISLGSSLPTITQPVTIQGPGAALITINGMGNQIFQLDSTSASVTNTDAISGLTLTNGGSATDGGAVYDNNQNLTLDSMTITANTATGDGAGLFTNGGTVIVTNSVFSNNKAADGVAIRNTGATVAIADTTIDGNTATNPDGTGGYYQSGGSSTITGSSFTNNVGGDGVGLFVTGGPTTLGTSFVGNNKSTNAGGPDIGGGLAVAGGQVTVQNSTISGNTANADGAGVDFQSGSLTIQNSTIAFNTADADNTGGGDGGGVFVATTLSVGLSSNIIAKNAVGTSGANPDVSGVASATSAFNLIGDSTGLTGISNGTQNNQIGTAGTPLDPMFVSTSPVFNGGPTPTFALQSTSLAIGTGTANTLPTDQRGAPFVRTAGAGTDIGAFQTQPNQALVVTTAQDLNSPLYNPANLSLREAIRLAGTNAPTITFAPALNGSTINLTLGTLDVNRSLSIQGPGASQLTVDGQGMFQPFLIFNGTASTLSTVSISGLTVQNGDSDPSLGGTGFGGGIESAENTTLDSVIVKNSKATSSGGGVAQAIRGTLKITNSWIDSNAAVGGVGGGVANIAGSTVKIVNTAITNNTSGTDGGGVASAFGTANLVVQNSTIASNKANADGGGVWVSAGSTFALDNSTVALNMADADNTGGGSGGGLFVAGLTTPATAQSTIVAKNTVGTSGTDPDIDGRIDTTKSLVFNTTGWDQSGSDAATIRGQDPLLGTLQNNGGLSPTLALQSGSPAIDAGSNPDSQTTDQRGTGFARTTGAATDIGAFEFGSTVTITITPATLPAAVVGTAYSQTLTAAGAAGPFTFTVTTGTLPAGLTLTSAGVLSGTPTAGGPSSFTVTATSGVLSGSQAYTLTVNASSSTVTITPATLPAGVVGTAYSQTLTAAGAAGPFSFAVTTGTLPAGLTLTSAGVLSGTPTAVGSSPFTVTATAGTASGSQAYTLTVAASSTPTQALVGATQFAVGADAGGSGVVTVYNANQSVAFTFTPFPGFTGGVRVATFQVGSTTYVAAATGPGVANQVVVYDGTTQAVVDTITPFESTFTGGLFVSAGVIAAGGAPDLIVTPDQTGGPVVVIYDGASLAGKSVNQVARFFGINDPSFRGGDRAAVGDVNGDGVGDVIVSAGYSGGPRIAIYDGTTISAASPTELVPDFFAFESTLRNGAYVAAGDLTGSGYADLIFGAGPGGAPRVRAVNSAVLIAAAGSFSSLDDPSVAGAGIADFFAGDPSSRGGIRVTVKNLDGDTKADLVVGDGTGAGSTVTSYTGAAIAASGSSPASGLSFDAFPGFTGGVFVG